MEGGGGGGGGVRGGRERGGGRGGGECGGGGGGGWGGGGGRERGGQKREVDGWEKERYSRKGDLREGLSKERVEQDENKPSRVRSDTAPTSRAVNRASRAHDRNVPGRSPASRFLRSWSAPR